MANTLIPKGSTILVTGANGFIASHIVDQLLTDGYNVRGTVRSRDKGESLQKHVDKTYGNDRFAFTVVEDITIDHAFDEAVKGVAGICHVATATILTSDYDKNVSQTIAGAVNILRPALLEPSVQSIVYTSDSYAVLLPTPNTKRTVKITDINDYAIRAAHDPAELERFKAAAWDPTVAVEFVIWAAAKAKAEESMWQFVSNHQPTFQLSTVVPNMNFGPPIGNLPASSTGKSILDLLLHKPKPDLYFQCQYFVNVRDCAKVHVAALLDPQQDGKRFFACAAPFNWNDVLHILRELRPDVRIRGDFDGLGRDLSVMPNGEAEELLRKWYGHGWTGLEETVRQNIARSEIFKG